MVKLKAAIAEGMGKYTIQQIKINNSKEDEVLVQMKAAGVSRSDLKLWNMRMIMWHKDIGMDWSSRSNISEPKEVERGILRWAVPCIRCFHD